MGIITHIQFITPILCVDIKLDQHDSSFSRLILSCLGAGITASGSTAPIVGGELGIEALHQPNPTRRQKPTFGENSNSCRPQHDLATSHLWEAPSITVQLKGPKEEKQCQAVYH